MPIDFGAHLHPSSTFPNIDRLEAINKLVDNRLNNAEKFFEMYDGSGIDGVVLSQPPYMGIGDASLVAETNDALLTEMENWTGNTAMQTYGLASLPVAAGGDTAAREFERALDAGYNGGAIETETDGIELVDEELHPVFEVAESTGAPIFVHPKLHDSLHPDAFDGRYRNNSVFGREAALSTSISKVIHEGVLDQYPDLNLVYHHLGGNIACMMGRVEVQLGDGRWSEQDHVKSFSQFKSQLEDRIYLDTSGFLGYPGPMREAIEQLQPSHLLFGTDYPFEPRSTGELAKFVETINSLSSKTDAADILENNALDLLVNT